MASAAVTPGRDRRHPLGARSLAPYGRDIRLIAFPVTALLVGVLPGAATAKLPKFTHPAGFSTHRIVDGVSIGGVNLGMSKSRAIATWGKPDGDCRKADPYDPQDRTRACDYGGFMKTRRGIESGPQEAGFDYLPSVGVTSVFVGLDTAAAAASASGRRFYDLALPKLRSFRTDRHIRLLGTMDGARHAYGIPRPPEDEYGKTGAFRNIIVRGPDACTVFWGNTAHKTLWTTIDKIAIYSAEWCPPDPEP